MDRFLNGLDNLRNNTNHGVDYVRLMEATKCADKRLKKIEETKRTEKYGVREFNMNLKVDDSEDL